MSVETGSDIPHDVFGGTLTEVGPSNMPSGGSPQNLNVEFLPGLARTRGGFQPQQNFAITGGPYQARYVKSYGQVPENQTELVLLVNPTTNAQGIVAIGPSTVVGNVYGYGNVLPWSPYAVNPGWNGPFAKSCTQFGREYIAISEGRYGYDLPRQWDGTNYDRVSQCGVGLAPTAVDSISTQPIAASPNGLQQLIASAISIIYEVGNTVYVVATLVNLTNPITFLDLASIAQPGDLITLAGTGVTAYNGTWPIQGYSAALQAFFFQNPTSGLATVTSTGTIATGYVSVTLSAAVNGQPAVGGNLTIAAATNSGYDGTWPIRFIVSDELSGVMIPTNPVVIYITDLGLSNSGGGTIKAVGSISPGLHQVSVSFITRQGYITKPAPPSSWTSKGYCKADISAIATGPSNVVARLLMFTPLLVPPAITGDFYSVRQTTSAFTTVMQINDNTTTSLTVDFSDSDLTTGFSADYLFGLVELGCCAGSFPYSSRMFWWGELNMLQDFLNMEFNGGWNLGGNAGGGDLPLGWSPLAFHDAGVATRLQNGGVWQDAYRITFSNAGGSQGGLSQGAYQNWEGEPLLAPLTNYSVRVTMRTSEVLAPLSVVLTIQIDGAVNSVATLSPGGGTYQTVIAPLSPSTTTVPLGSSLNFWATGPAGATLDIDRIEIFPTNQPINFTVLRVSYASDPESFDGVTGLIQPIYSNGDAIRTVYPLRDSMYVSAGRSTFVTRNVPGSEPSFWTIDSVSDSIGAVSPNAAAGGEDWEVKANRYGLYLYLGREPEKLSQEIQTLWNKQGYATLINWQYGYKIWATVDLQNKRIYIGAPINGATDPNALFVMDYNTLDTSDMIAQYPTLRFSPYTGRRVILEQGRKWTIWQFNGANSPLSIPCGAFIEQSNGLALFVLGSNADLNGNSVFFIDPTQRGNDNGTACVSNYTSHFFPTQDEEQGLQLRGHMHGFSFARMYVSGAGVMTVKLYENTLGSATNPTNPVIQFNVNLSNPAIKDSENVVDNFTAERWSLQWQTNQLNSWWQMERFTRVVELPPDLIRGSNIQ